MQDVEIRQNIIKNILGLLEHQYDDLNVEHMEKSFSFLKHNKDLVHAINLSKESIDSLSMSVLDLHLLLIHSARLKLVKYLLPQGNVILDLGGANAPLYHMGYSHPFEKLILIDLPTEDRHKDFQVELDVHTDGKVILMYDDMTKLKGIEANSVDLVWSGQSIEHISQSKGNTMCKEVFRVLKNGGHFCLDTPNRLLTSLHTRNIGGGYVHPDHKIEYTPDQLRALLRKNGFHVLEEWGICEMPMSSKEQKFIYEDFIYGGAISKNINDSYIQFFHCQKNTASKTTFLTQIKTKIKSFLI